MASKMKSVIERRLCGSVKIARIPCIYFALREMKFSRLRISHASLEMTQANSSDTNALRFADMFKTLRTI